MTFEAAQAYLLGTISETVSPRTSYKLDRIAALLAALGDPQRSYPTVHVAGTSGKGSTSTMISAALQARGLRSGLHTKPHLVSMTERARIDGNPVSQERFAELLEEMMPAIERVAGTFGPPTYYETLLALAFLHFARERVDVATIEAGLGGRLDGTNVIVPEVAAITSVGFDHTAVLGNTLEAIAREKAGIAKRGVPLVVAGVPPEALAEIERSAASAGAPLVRVTQRARVENVRVGDRGQAFEVVTTRGRYAIDTPVRGGFQRDNAATAIVALESLPPRLQPDIAQVEEAMRRLEIPGRLEIVGTAEAPLAFDVAHNVEKAERLVAALRECFPGAPRFRYVVAVSEDKDAAEIVRALAALPAVFTFTTFSAQGRACVAPAILLDVARALGVEAEATGDPAVALEAVRRCAQPGEPVIVTGSTFVVAELRQWYPAVAAR